MFIPEITFKILLIFLSLGKKRTEWPDQEMEALVKLVQTSLKKKKPPKREEVEAYKEVHACLKYRHWLSIKHCVWTEVQHTGKWLEKKQKKLFTEA